VAAGQLDAAIECNLLYGECFGAFDIEHRTEFARPWLAWRDELTARWVEAFPGSRPMAAYLLGEITPPVWQHPLPAFRKPMRPITGINVSISDTGWHRGLPELDHLVEIGLVDDDEHALAVERLASLDPIDYRRYRKIALI
jgi:hypothetical protein